jgi:RNA polymerase sigma-70 factor (ECF subfamily)
MRLCTRDITALEALFDNHHQMALGLARKITPEHDVAEEIVQEAFLTLWRQPGRFTQLGDERSWLLALVYSSGLDWLRRARDLESAATVHGGHQPVCQRDMLELGVRPEQLLVALDVLPAGRRGHHNRPAVATRTSSGSPGMARRTERASA